MNILGLVFGLLLIFACTFSLSMRKSILTKPVEKTYVANLKASRRILNEYERLCYSGMPGEKKKSEPTKKEKGEKKETQRKKRLNSDCARLNLWPLLEGGAKEHPALYQTAARLLRTYYAEPLFSEQKKFEYTVLDSLLRSARLALKDPNVTRISLEKLTLKEGNVKQLYPMQAIYYRMLKGTKKFTLDEGYPSLLDFFCLESKESSVCLKHASLEMLVALFGRKSGELLYQELRESENPGKEQERLAHEYINGKELDVLNLVDFRSHCRKASGQKTLVQEVGNVRLKKRVFLPTS